MTDVSEKKDYPLKLPTSLLTEVGFLFQNDTFIFPSEYNKHPEKLFLNGNYFVPGTNWWENKSLIHSSSVYIFDSVIQALSFCSLRKLSLEDTHLLAIGSASQILKKKPFYESVKGKKIRFVFPNTLIGKINETLFAFELRKKELKIRSDGEFIVCSYQNIMKRIPSPQFSLNRVMKEYGMLLKHIRTVKPPKPYTTFYQMLCEN